MLIALIVVAAIGVIGQAWWLSHRLTECLPYKALYANLDLYVGISTWGIWLSPLALILAWLLSRGRPATLPALATTLAPAIYATAYAFAHATAEASPPLRPFMSMPTHALILAACGAGIGGITGWLITRHAPLK